MNAAAFTRKSQSAGNLEACTTKDATAPAAARWLNRVFRSGNMLQIGGNLEQELHTNTDRAERRHSAPDQSDDVPLEQELNDTPKSSNLMDKYKQLKNTDRCNHKSSDEHPIDAPLGEPISSTLPRPPSLPSSIQSLDDCKSTMSELTLVTISDERAAAIKEEFFRRWGQRTDQNLTQEEKEELLNEIQAEEEVKWMEMKREHNALEGGKGEKDKNDILATFEKLLDQNITLEEKEALAGETHAEEEVKSALTLEGEKEEKWGGKGKRPSEVERLEMFDRLNALRLQKQDEQSERRLSDQPLNDEDDEPEEGGDEELEGCDVSLKLDDLAKEDRRASFFQSRRDSRRSIRRSSIESSFNSKATAKHGNASKEIRDEILESWATGEGVGEREYQGQKMQDRPHQASTEPPPKDATSYDAAETSSIKTRMNIDELIELKLLAANQQATIDNLSSRVHNLELANTQLKKSASRVKELEVENQRLATQLSQCQQRELSLSKQLNSQLEGKDREELMRQFYSSISSNVVWD